MLTPKKLLSTLSLALLAVVATACDAPAASEGEGEGEGENLGPTCTEPAVVDCEDEVFIALTMDLNANAPGLIDSTPVDGVFEVDVDARAGGFGGTQGWVYGSFTDDGLLKVDISDIDSLGSMDWDIAFRRFVIRVNSGYGGPSCVTAARTAADTDFDALAAVPADLRFNTEEFMSDPEGCTVISDGSGLPDSPGVVLQNWWTYPGCVATTGNVYVLSLKDGRRLKLVVTQFYAGDGAQDSCNDLSQTAGESGRIKLRYAFFE
jgi:hypothetical protein